MFKKIIQFCAISSIIFNFISCGDKDLITNEGKNTSTYKVGGSVSGLTGDLVLQLNDEETLSIDDNDSFQFNKKLDNNDQYLVEVLEAPFNQNCSINNAVGEINAANVNNVSIVCSNKVWTIPSITDSISPATPGYFPKVAMDAQGNAIVVWAQFNGMFSQVYKAELRNGVWSYPTDVNDNISPETAEVSDPEVAMDDNGNAIIVWTQSDGFNNQLFKSEYRNGAWTHPVNQQDNISPNNENAYSPTVAMDNNGNAIISWSESDGGLPQIFMSQYRNGAWIHPANLADNISVNNQMASNPSLAMSDNGDALIVWQQFTGVNVALFKSEYRNGTWTHPATIDDHFTLLGGNAFNPSVAMDTHGQTMISWTQHDGNVLQIFKSEYSNGLWTHPTTLSDNISPDLHEADNSRVVMNNHDVVIAWIGHDGSNYQAYKSEYRNGAWSNPVNADDNISPAGQNVTNVPMLNNIALTIDSSGNTIIVWTQSDGSNVQFFKSVYQNNAWIHPANLSDNISLDGFDVFDISIAMNDMGASVLSWSQYNGANSQIYKAEYR
jgi:hypothetical protein